MVPLCRVTPEVGGLQVVPKSHTDGERLRTALPHLASYDDWCPLPRSFVKDRDAMLLLAEAGDLIIWDSRTVHGALVGKGGDGTMSGGNSSSTQLARLSVMVSMTPRARASKEVLAARAEGFFTGKRSFNHVPHEAGTSSGTVHATVSDYKPCESSEAQLSLL